MSSRPGVHLTVRVPADGGSAPNAHMPYVTAELRVFWPPKATDDQIIIAFAHVLAKAATLIAQKRGAPAAEQIISPDGTVTQA